MNLLAAALCAACLQPVAAAAATPGTGGGAAPPAAAPDQTPMTLERVVELARTTSPQARAADIRARAAAATVDLAGRWPNPSVDLRTENWQPGGRAPGDPLVDAFVVVSQPIELGAKAAARKRLATADAAVRESEQRRAARDAGLEAAHAFVAAVRARDRRTLIAEQQDGTREVVATLQKRVAEGVAPEADLRKVEADLARLDVNAVRADIELARQLAVLTAVLALPAPVTAAQLVTPTLTAAPAGDATGLEAQPDVALARQQAAVAAASADLARRQVWPDLLVSGGYKRTAGVDTAVAGVSVALPLTGHHRRTASIADADRASASLLAEDTERRVRAAVDARLAAARALRARAVTIETDLLAPAEIARRAARSSFREGAGDVLRLLDAERVYGEARREASELILDAVLAAVEARLALGGE